MNILISDYFLWIDFYKWDRKVQLYSRKSVSIYIP